MSGLVRRDLDGRTFGERDVRAAGVCLGLELLCRFARAAADVGLDVVHVRAVLAETRAEHQPVRLLGVGVSDFSAEERPVQTELFAPQAPDGRVDRTLDAIREKFGKSAAHRGRGGAGGTDSTPLP